MTKVELETYDDIMSTLNKIRNINDSGVEIEIPEGSILFENVLNLKLIKKQADKYGTTVHFATQDPTGNTIIEMVEGGIEGFTPIIAGDEEIVSSYKMNAKKMLPFAGLTGLGGAFKGFKMPRLKAKGYFLPIIIALILLGAFHLAKNTSDASVKLFINSQPLTKSLTVKVKANNPTDPATKILAGTNIQNTIDFTKETPTTGEKIVGESAEGKAKIFNKTDADATFKKGHILRYEEGDTDLEFTLDAEVTVPAATEDNTDPLNPVPVYGEAEVNVTAVAVGVAGNIEKNNTLAVDDEKKADYSAVSVDAFSGGKSEKKKVVADADVKKLQAEIDTEVTTKSNETLTQKVANSQELVAGSGKTTTVKESLSHKVGDETDTLSITRTVSVDGLAYLKDELNRLLDALVKDLVPEGYVLSSKDREMTVDILGSSSNSVLSSTEADIQVTLKAFVVPDISEDAIKVELAGKTSKEAQDVLGRVRNIKTFEFNLNRGLIPLFNTVPKNLDKIKVEIVKE